MARTAIFLLALLAVGYATASKVQVEKIQPSDELADLVDTDVEGDASFSPPELKYKKQAVELAPLPEIQPLEKAKEVLAPITAPLTAISGAPVVTAPPPKDIKNFVSGLLNKAPPPTIATAVSGVPVAVSGAPIVVPAEKPKKSLLKKKDPLDSLLPEKNIEVPVYSIDLSKDKKSKDGRKML